MHWQTQMQNPDVSPQGGPSLENIPDVLESLAPSVVILDAFAFRHQNQHSHSHWFSKFSILRRRVHRLTRLMGSQRPKPNRIEQHAYHLKVFTERAYVTFSQLAADNQHAPLGVTLLAVLAAINSALQCLLPNASTQHQQKQIPQIGSSQSDKGVSVSRSSLASKPQKKSSVHVPPMSSSKKTKHPKPEEGSKERKKKKKAKDDDELSRLFGSIT